MKGMRNIAAHEYFGIDLWVAKTRTANRTACEAG